MEDNLLTAPIVRARVRSATMTCPPFLGSRVRARRRGRPEEGVGAQPEREGCQLKLTSRTPVSFSSRTAARELGSQHPPPSCLPAPRPSTFLISSS